MNQGLYKKYNVTKADGTPTDPAADYFVLRLDTDPASRRAMLVYLVDVADENPVLAQDLLDRLIAYDADVVRGFLQRGQSFQQPPAPEPTLEYHPDSVSPPGDILLEALAVKAGFDPATAERIVLGHHPLEISDYEDLVRTFPNTPRSFWENLESAYRASLADPSQPQRMAYCPVCHYFQPVSADNRLETHPPFIDKRSSAGRAALASNTVSDTEESSKKEVLMPDRYQVGRLPNGMVQLSIRPEWPDLPFTSEMQPEVAIQLATELLNAALIKDATPTLLDADAQDTNAV